ncbi:hypothetical protein WN943_011792 [Citrus x changshan-huyou]
MLNNFRIFQDSSELKDIGILAYMSERLPEALVAVKRRRLLALSDEEEEEEVVLKKKSYKRKLVNDFDRFVLLLMI